MIDCYAVSPGVNFLLIKTIWNLQISNLILPTFILRFWYHCGFGKSNFF